MPDYEGMYFVLEDKLAYAIEGLESLSDDLKTKKRRSRVVYTIGEVERLLTSLKTIREDEIDFFLPPDAESKQ